MKLHILILGCIALLLTSGCSEVFRSNNVLVFISTPTISANPNPSVPLGAVLKFETNRPVHTKICITDGENAWCGSFNYDEEPSKGLAIVGMRPGRIHRIHVEARDRDENVLYSPELKYRTLPLPKDPAEFPKIEVDIRDSGKVEPGYTLFNPRRRLPDPQNRPADFNLNKFNQSFGMLVAADWKGEVVWYYRGNSRISDFKFIRNGNIVFITQDNRLVEIDLLGNIVNQWYAKGRPEGAGEGIPVDTLTFHHSVKELPNGHFLILGTDRRQIEDYYTSETDANAPRKTHWVMGDEIVEFDRSGKVIWRWNAFDHLDPFRIGYQTFSGYWKRRGWPGTIDWSHANNVSYLEEDNAVLCNMRYQSAILKIDRNSGEIVWIAGEPTGWPEKMQNKLLKLEGSSEWFWHQHAPEITPDGTLLLFNNDNFRARPFEKAALPSEIRSHAVEYSIDEKAKIICQVWTSSPADKEVLASWAMGSARVMPETGNVLAGLGFMFQQEDIENATWATRQQFIGKTRIHEYTRHPETELVWELTLSNIDTDSSIGWTLYGARRVKSLYNE